MIELLLALTISKESLKFQFVHEQALDASCGYSTVSTLLDLYWDIPMDEWSLLKEYVKNNGEEDGFSTLKDLAQVIHNNGLENKAFKMKRDELKKALKSYAPIIVHYDKPEMHFALLLGVKDNFFVTADPARGIELLSERQFEKRWSGTALLVAKRTKKVNKEILNTAISESLDKRKLLERMAW